MFINNIYNFLVNSSNYNEQLLYYLKNNDLVEELEIIVDDIVYENLRYFTEQRNSEEYDELLHYAQDVVTLPLAE